MIIFIGQIYTKVGITFPFSLRFQKWLGDALSTRVEASEHFTKQFGKSFALGIRISAKDGILTPEIKGPTVFKKDKTVEFTIFLPHASLDYHDQKVIDALLGKLLDSVVLVLSQIGLNPTTIVTGKNLLITEFHNDPLLLEAHKMKTGKV